MVQYNSKEEFCLPFQVKFLKDLLEAWKSEVEKKPPDLSVEQALKILNLKKKPEE